LSAARLARLWAVIAEDEKLFETGLYLAHGNFLGRKALRQARGLRNALGEDVSWSYVARLFELTDRLAMQSERLTAPILDLPWPVPPLTHLRLAAEIQASELAPVSRLVMLRLIAWLDSWIRESEP